MDSVNGESEEGGAGSSEPVNDGGPHEASIRGQVHPKTLLRGVINYLVGKVGPQEWFAAHQCKHPAGSRVQPVDGSLGNVLRHPLHTVFKCPAVVTIKIALPLR